MCGLLALCTNFGDRLTAAPLNRLAGLTICRGLAHHNPAYTGQGDDVPEVYCKDKPIL
jgi:hypothetical protein